MNFNKIIIIILFAFALKSKAQNTLPYSAPNFCFDQAIKVNASQVNNTKNLVVANLTGTGSQKDIIVTDVINGYIKFYSFVPATGSFSFQALITVTGGFGTGINQAVDVGNFDGNTLPDIVFTTDNTIYVFKNLGNYNFSLMYQITIPSSFIGKEHYLKVDNIDNTLYDEFYFISSSGTGLTVMPYQNTGTALFQAGSQNIFMSNSFLPASVFDISLGNIKNDPDGLKDVMITYNMVADSVVFLENTSLPGNLSSTYYETYLSPAPQASPDFYIKRSEIADVNADGKLDFIFIGNGAFGDKIKVYAGINGFNLTFHIDIPTVCNFTDFKIGHINDDANVDFVGMGTVLGFSGVVVYPGNGNNITYFNPSTTMSLPTISHPDELQLSDVDANGLNDIVFKPWKGNSDHTFMISNHSFKLNASPIATTACSSKAATITVTSISTLGTYSWKDTSGNVITNGSVLTTTASGQYAGLLNITMYSNSICTRYSDTVQVNSSAPPISLSDTTLNLCYGDNFAVTASGAASYTWTSPSNTLTNTGPTVTIQGQVSEQYTVTGVATTGCIGTNTLDVNVHLENTEVISASKNPACVGDIITLSFPAAQSYSWSTTESNQSIAVSPGSVTVYQLEVIDSNGCPASKSITITIDQNCQPKIYTGITINGTNNKFTIDNIENYKNNNVSIFNRWGKEIFTTPAYNNTTNYWPTAEHLKTLIPSTYFFVVNFGDGSEIQKGWVELITN